MIYRFSKLVLFSMVTFKLETSALPNFNIINYCFAKFRMNSASLKNLKITWKNTPDHVIVTPKTEKPFLGTRNKNSMIEYLA